MLRAKILLLLAGGTSYDAIKAKLDTTAPTISRWKKRFLAAGLDGFDVPVSRPPSSPPGCVPESSRPRVASPLTARRGLLAEYGIVLPQQLSRLRKELPMLLEDGENELTPMGRSLFASLFEELLQLEERIEAFDVRLAAVYRQSLQCRRIAEVEGIGPVTATALVAAICDGKSFTNGRQLSAWLGLIPRQRSSGDKQSLLGISKRGDPYLRTLLIHGTRSVVYRAKGKTDARSRWIAEKQARLKDCKRLEVMARLVRPACSETDRGLGLRGR